MNGLRSTIKYLGFYVAPANYTKHLSLYVMSKEGHQKVATFTNNEQAELFMNTLEQMFEDSTTTWDLIGPCNSWEQRGDSKNG